MTLETPGLDVITLRRPTGRFSSQFSLRLLAVALLLIPFIGCTRKAGAGKKSKGPDFQYGWYHWANGKESVESIAQAYKRNPELVAEVNRHEPKDVPKPKALIYLPPTEDRSALIQILKKVNQDPKIVPKTPPTAAQLLAFEQSQAKAVAAVKPPRPQPSAETKPPVATSASAVNSGSPNPPPAAAPASPPASSSTSIAQSAAPPPAGASKAANADPPKTQESPPSPPPPKVVATTETQPPPAPSTSSSSSIPEKPASISVSPGQHGAFAWPIRGKILREFKADPASPFRGILIAATAGAAVAAARDGKVVFAGELDAYGKVIIIEHDSGLLTVYGFNESLKVKNRQEVRAGQQIATAGRPPGLAENQILFEIRKNARPIDPLIVLPPS